MHNPFPPSSFHCLPILFLGFRFKVFLRYLVIYGHQLLFKLIGGFDTRERIVENSGWMVFWRNPWCISLCLSLWADQIPKITLFQFPSGRVKAGLPSSKSRGGRGQKFQPPVLMYLILFFHPCAQGWLGSSRPGIPLPQPPLPVFPFQRINLQSFAVVGQWAGRLYLLNSIPISSLCFILPSVPKVTGSTNC